MDTLLQFASHEPLTGENGLTNDERTIWGLVIDYVKCTLEERLSLIDVFLPCMDNWSSAVPSAAIQPEIDDKLSY